MNCPVCDTRMTYNTRSTDSIMAGPECPNGCRVCVVCGKESAEPDSDGCAECELAEAIRVMNSEGFSQENQAEVARWQLRVSRKAVAA